MVSKIMKKHKIEWYRYDVKDKTLFIYQSIPVKTLVSIRDQLPKLKNIIVKEHKGGYTNEY